MLRAEVAIAGVGDMAAESKLTRFDDAGRELIGGGGAALGGVSNAAADLLC